MEVKLKELVDRLKSAAGGNLKAAVLYGSAVTGEFQKEHSDLNILCIVERAGSSELEALHTAADWWMREGNPSPLIFTLEELARSADVFAIELLDMKSHHRMLLGDDFLEGLNVPLRLHRLQVERELRNAWLRLRQAILAAPQKRRARLGIMLASVATFCTLFRHALIALGRPAPLSKREAVDGAASLTGANAMGFQSILDLREGKSKEKEIDVEAALHAYLEFVEVITDHVDRAFETS